MRARAGTIFGAVSAAGLGWGWFEAGWVRFRQLELPVGGASDDVRVVHLSDFHLGIPSRGSRAVARAVEWAAEREPDLVCITGDLVSRPRGEPLLRELLHTLPPTYVVLGNHDVEFSRDPFSRAAGLTELDPARLLVDEAATIDVRGMRVQLVGVDPRTYRTGTSRPWELVDQEADVRILLCHFPRIFDRLPAGAFDLVLAGHMHDGQISVPLPRSVARYRLRGRPVVSDGCAAEPRILEAASQATPRDKLRLAHINAPFTTGLYKRDGMWMHVSPGLGTTFVPLRFYARPEATELVLRR